MEEPKRDLPPVAEFYGIDGSGPIQNEAAFDEIANAILRLRAAFIKAGFKPPKELHLADHEDGFRLRHILPRDMIHANLKAGDGDKDEVSFNICGIELRYPARHRRRPNGIDTF